MMVSSALRRLMLVVVVAGIGAACSTSPVVLHDGQSSGLAGRSLIVGVHEPPAMMVESASARVAGGVIGILVWPLAGIAVGMEVAEGKALVRDNQIADPAVSIGVRLAGRLREARGVVLTRELPETLATGDIERLAGAYPDSDLMLEVRTLYWNINYFRRDWSKFHVAYGVRVELVDLRRRRSLARGECSRSPEQPEQGMSRDELLSDGAIRVKNFLAEAGADCAIELGNALFGQ